MIGTGPVAVNQESMRTLLKTALGAGVWVTLSVTHAWADKAPPPPTVKPAPGLSANLPLPGPFPLPYANLAIAAQDDIEKDYLTYLRTTQVFPDQGVCTREIERRAAGKVRSGSLTIAWVTPPYLAWGGKLGGDAIVGPIRHLYSITEAHVSLEGLDHKVPALLTLSCFAQYPELHETGIWRAGHIRYGAYVNAGHGKYLSGAAVPFGQAPSGTPTAWDPQIRYLRK